MGVFDFFKNNSLVKSSAPANFEARAPKMGSDAFGVNFLSETTSVKSEQGVMAIATAYRCMSVVANTVAMLQGDIYKDRTKNNSHQQYELWFKKPNDLVNAFKFKNQLTLNLQNLGNGFAVAKRERGIIVAYQIRRNLETIIHEGERYYFDRKYDEVYYNEDVIHLADIGVNEFTGLSRIKQHAQLFGKTKAALDYVNAMYSNKMFLGGAIQYPESVTMTKEKSDAIREMTQQVYGGIEKSGKLFTIDQGGQLKQFDNSMPLSDAEYILSERLTNEDMCRVYGVPPFKVFEYNKMSGESMEAAKIEFAESTIMPIVTQLEQEINNKAFVEKNTTIKFNLKSLLRADIKSQAEYWSKMTAIGKYTINELRALDDDDPVVGGDKPLIQANNYFPLDRLDEYADAMIQEKLSRARKLDADADAVDNPATANPSI